MLKEFCEMLKADKREMAFRLHNISVAATEDVSDLEIEDPNNAKMLESSNRSWIHIEKSFMRISLVRPWTTGSEMQHFPQHFAGAVLRMQRVLQSTFALREKSGIL